MGQLGVKISITLITCVVKGARKVDGLDVVPYIGHRLVLLCVAEHAVAPLPTLTHIAVEVLELGDDNIF